MQFKVLTLLFSTMFLSALTPAFAGKMGTESGGGGDASEVRVNEIRADILSWLEKEGGKELALPSELSYEEYKTSMIEILQPQKVVIGFVEKDDEVNEELMVSVGGMPKTCRGFISRLDSRPHILCNISRFASTSESLQYQLIHHEYAGLVNVENNQGSASDYSISSQLTDFLVPQVVLKLAVKKVGNQSEYRTDIACLKNATSGRKEVLLVEQKIIANTGIIESLKVLQTYTDFDSCIESMGLGQTQEVSATTRPDEELLSRNNCFSSTGSASNTHFLVNEKRDPDTGLIVKLDVLNEFTSLKYCKDNL